MPLQYEQYGAVVLLTLSDPATRNALHGDELFSSFERARDRINADLSVGAAVLTGEGHVFCSGGNVADMHARRGMFGGTPAEIEQQYRAGIQRVPLAVLSLDVPLIAAVNGPAIGAGCDLACACDLRIASATASFSESFVRLGIVPGDGGAWLLTHAVGYARAVQMALTGEPVDAMTAKAIGLVSDVVPGDNVVQCAVELAARMAANPPQVVRLTKRLLRQARTATFEDVLTLSASYQALAHHTVDHTEALAAMRAKREPNFHGR